MKVVHLSTSDMGGAGIAAKRLHLALLERGIDSFFLTRFSYGPETRRHRAIAVAPRITFMMRIMRRIRNVLPSLFFDPARALRGRVQGYEHFSFPYPGEDIRHQPEVKAADIIHLHWVADGMLDYRKFFRGLEKPVVWTLHDMNPFTGGCHHSDGVERFVDTCSDCPQLQGTGDTDMARRNLDYKADALRSIAEDQLAIVTPSQWLSAHSQKSRLFKRFVHRVIPNVVGHEVFAPLDRLAVRKNLKIPAQAFVLLFVANDVDNPRKGISLMLAALKGLSLPRLFVCTVGKGLPPGALSDPHINFGFVKDDSLMADIYNAADLFVLPSLAENFPNTVAEALLCGTPVVASRTGGIPEQLDESSGIVFTPGSVAELRDAIKGYHDNSGKFDRAAIRNQAVARFEDQHIVDSYLSCYKSLSEKS